MFKILLLGPSLEIKGGVSNYVKLLTKNINNSKYHIKYFASGKSSVRWKNILIPLIILVQLVKLKIILKKYQPDLIHINPSLGWWAVFRDFFFSKIIKANGFPVLFFIHGWETSVSDKFRKKIFWRNYFTKRFDMFNGIVVLAKDFKQKILDLGIYEKKIFLSTTMVDSKKFLPEKKKFSKPYKVLFCANMEREKGPYELLESITLVLDKKPDTHFIFIGNGIELENLKLRAKKIGIEENINFTGYIQNKEKIKLFKTAHIFAYPSYFGEGFPTVILEAMASGMPIITTKVAGLKDSLKNGKEGFLLKTMPSEPKEIAGLIIQLIESPELMKIIYENNLKEIKEKYDVSVVTKQMEVIYRNIINNYN